MKKVSFMIIIIRYVYVGIALCLVCNAFYKEYEKWIAEDISRRQEYRASEQRRYPSITFCYKFDHGKKQVIDNYLPKFVEKAKTNACVMDLMRTQGAIIRSLTGISNASSCNGLCQNNSNCSVWTYFDGLCYMKNDKTFLIKSDSKRIVSGMKKSDGKDYIMVGVDQYGGDIEAIPANDFEECREKCNETPNCQRWTHQTSKEGACYLKYEDVEKEYRPNGDVAVCHHCKTGFQNSKDRQCGATGIFDDLKLDFSDGIPSRNSFLKNFTQRFRGEEYGVDVLNQDENWEVLVPNENSGPCYTYNPAQDSDPGDTNSMYMVFDSSDWDPLLEIFIHGKNDFFYSKRQMLNTKLITTEMLKEAQTKYPRALVRISTEKKINTARMPCNDDPEYNFFKCAENYYSKKRGCNYPWSSNKMSNTTDCGKYTELSPLIWHYNQNIDTGAGRENFKLSEIILQLKNDCPPPCFQTTYSVGFEKWAWFSDATPVSLQLALDGFTFYHEEEFYKCDTTCIIGELGGNMGFFLGASVLLSVDILISGIRTLFKNQLSPNERKRIHYEHRKSV